MALGHRLLQAQSYGDRRAVLGVLAHFSQYHRLRGQFIISNMSTSSSAPRPPPPPNPLHVLTVNPRDYLINWVHLVNLAQDFYGRVLSKNAPATEESIEIHFYDADNALSHKDLFMGTLTQSFGRREEGGETAALTGPEPTHS
jgi:hypothetical protein